MKSRLCGKTVLVDIRDFDATGRLMRSRNYIGTIVDVDEGGIDIRRHDTGAIDRLAATEEDLEDASEEDYWLRSTGESVPKPDFLAEWTHTV
jgi:hypothetical protein